MAAPRGAQHGIKTHFFRMNIEKELPKNNKCKQTDKHKIYGFCIVHFRLTLSVSTLQILSCIKLGYIANEVYKYLYIKK